jgi:hypothetical protein
MPARGPRVALALAGALLLGALVLGAAPARALAPPAPWDGTNPFNCTVQDAGQGTAVPDPGADPYCVRFDKTNQNLTELGLVQFLSLEPARTAAAAPKCFYYQEDHWRGSIVQSDPSTALYEFVGHYFFNKATGDGGVWVTGFTVAGQTFDPTSLPGFPPGYGQYFGPGTGGFITHDDVPADPTCVAKAKADPAGVYAAAADGPRCTPALDGLSQSTLGPLTLGMQEDAVRAKLGPPLSVQRGFLRYCVAGGGNLLVGEPGDRSGTLGSSGRDPAVMLIATSHTLGLLGRGGREVAVGASTAAVHKAFPRPRSLLRLGQTRIVRLRGTIIAALSQGHVAYLATYDPRQIRTHGSLASYLRRAG